MAHKEATDSTDDAADLSPQALREVLQNLRVHQIKLEMQNEELRRAQSALDTAHARYFDFYDLAPVGYVTVNDKAQILQANLSTATLLGLPRADLIGKALPGFMAPPDADHYYLFSLQALTSYNAQSCELQIRQANGDAVWVSLQAIAVPGDAGAAVIRMVLSDITSRKQTEAQRLANNKFRNAILDSLPSQIAVLDQTGNIVAVNQRWHDFALDNSATPGEPVGRTAFGTNYLDICQATSGSDTDGGAALARDGIMRVINGSAPSFYMEYPCHSPTQQCWFSMAVTPLPMENNAVVVTHTDITQRRQLEQAEKEASEGKLLLAEHHFRVGELHYQELIAGLPVGVLLHGQHAEILLSNAIALDLLGLTEDQLLGKTSFDADWNVIHEDGLPFPGPTHPVPQAISSRQPVRNVVMGSFGPPPRIGSGCW
jgi:PAS domain S-box-containing protein